MAPNPTIRITPPGVFVEVDGDTLFLGRDCHLVNFIPSLLNKVVSNRHCVVRREGDRWMLEDLGSTNGTWVRGTRLFGKILLHTGDIFSLGRQGPACQCHQGFGGQGAGATLPEGDEELWTHDPGDPREAPTVVDGRDGSAEKPYRAGRTPEIVLRDTHTDKEYRALGHTVVIGRDPSGSQIVLRDREEKHVSGRHAEIALREGKAFVRDLGSRNGTRLNFRPVLDEEPLAPGDKLEIGSNVTVLEVVRFG